MCTKVGGIYEPVLRPHYGRAPSAHTARIPILRTSARCAISERRAGAVKVGGDHRRTNAGQGARRMCVINMCNQKRAGRDHLLAAAR